MVVEALKYEDYPVQTSDKIRYADTDRQGHVNNAVFATFLETGRVEILYDPAQPLTDVDSEFVIAKLVLNFKSDIRWPGTIRIGTRIASVGRSSVTLEQGLFQNDRCVATAETVIVLMDQRTRKSRPLPEHAIKRLSSL
ncbi:MAG: acyl-CoA thioesterase [Gammaproteobacteria bacterium]|jgi:acyl-CoA thioester hydrolase|nr:acyl-CoA thioesterase [Gammaproteobacteria bacterium]